MVGSVSACLPSYLNTTDHTYTERTFECCGQQGEEQEAGAEEEGGGGGERRRVVAPRAVEDVGERGDEGDGEADEGVDPQKALGEGRDLCDDVLVAAVEDGDDLWLCVDYDGSDGVSHTV